MRYYSAFIFELNNVGLSISYALRIRCGSVYQIIIMPINENLLFIYTNVVGNHSTMRFKLQMIIYIQMNKLNSFFCFEFDSIQWIVINFHQHLQRVIPPKMNVKKNDSLILHNFEQMDAIIFAINIKNGYWNGAILIPLGSISIFVRYPKLVHQYKNILHTQIHTHT